MITAIYPSLKGRVVFVTGGASGIGESLVREFTRQGSQVAFVDIDADAGQALCIAVAGTGAPKPWFAPTDVTQVGALRTAIEDAARALGPIDVLVNNAANDDRHATAELTPDYWRDRLAVNLDHHVFAAQAVAPAMIRRGSGSIINMGSIYWRAGLAGAVGYATAKAGLVGLTRTLAREWGEDGIRVNCVMPGATLTERQKRLWMTPDYERHVFERQCLKRHIQPEEVSAMVLFLASDDASAVTSQEFIVDAGWV